MKCPHCGKDVPNKLVLSEAGRIKGRKGGGSGLSRAAAREMALARHRGETVSKDDLTKFRVWPETLAKIGQELDRTTFVKSIPISEFLWLSDDTGIELSEFRPADIGQWKEWPHLWVDTDSKIVHAHEGRHRLKSMQAYGYTHCDIIVMITPLPEQFKNHIDALAWEWNGYMPEWGELSPIKRQRKWQEASTK